ncbi:MAG: T9SS type A sorting domain-containing protein, partial [Chitinophagales bacterium]
GIPISAATLRNYFATGTGSYTVTVTNENGCSKTSPVTNVTSSCRMAEAEELLTSKLSLYPNPSNGQFIAELQFSEDVNVQADIEILNTLGQSIYLNRTAVVNGKMIEEVKFDGSVPAGNYFVRVTAGNSVYTGRIIYQK